ncbi:uncharacterized protein [Dermacentor albipictus]|uniref:uncharacterized protein isoform X2 n=1 Tax=Dermacentor albipictus TaxID=60249 RepID=UPI0038FCB958
MAAASLHRLRQIGGPDDRAQPCQRQRTDSTRCPRHRDSSLGTLLFPDIWRGAIHGTFVDHTDPRLSQQCLAPYGIGWCWLHPCGTCDDDLGRPTLFPLYTYKRDDESDVAQHRNGGPSETPQGIWRGSQDCGLRGKHSYPAYSSRDSEPKAPTDNAAAKFQRLTDVEVYL